MSEDTVEIFRAIANSGLRDDLKQILREAILAEKNGESSASALRILKEALGGNDAD
jgi:hypothetical protein